MTERQVAMISGATGGLGRVLARELAEDGYDLALVSSDQGRLDSLRTHLGIAGERVHAVAANLRDADAATSAIEAIYERFGRIDALAHLVGGWVGGINIGRSTDEPYASMIDQHFWTTLNVARELVPRMMAAGSGRIVVVSSPMAAAPDAGMSAYGVGKAAQETLLAALSKEVAGTDITVNVVRVRAIDTEAGPGGSEKDDATSPAEISAAIRYLFSERARVVTGQRLGLHRGM